MSLSAEDRVALILGRAIHRAEALTVQLEQAQARIEGATSILEDVLAVVPDVPGSVATALEVLNKP